MPKKIHKIRVQILNASDKDTKEMRIQKLNDKMSPPGRIEKARRWFKQLNEPISFPKWDE